MKILLATDFSNPANVAARYAADIAQKLSAELILLHVIYIQGPPKAIINEKGLENKMIETARENCVKLVNRIKAPNENGKAPDMKCEVINGYPLSEVINSYVKNNDIDLVVMGTFGASGLKKILMGSNAAAVINTCSVPVMVIPGQAVFKPLRKVVFASDLWHVSHEMKKVVLFARLFDSEIHILHINTAGTGKQFDINRIKNSLVTGLHYPEIFIHEAANDDIVHSIEAYIEDRGADLLILFSHHLSFYEKLSGKGITRNIAFRSHCPLLSIRKE